MKKKTVFLPVFFISVLVFLPVALFAGGNRQSSPAASTGADDLSIPYTYSFAMINWGQLHGTDFNSDEVARYFREKYNFQWDVTQTTWDDWVDRPRIWINSMDMPDLVFTDLNFNEYRSYMEQGLVKRLPDGWKQTYTNLARLFEGTMIGPELEKRVPGNQGVFPNIIYADNMPTKPRIAGHYSVFFRKDWATALGMPIKDSYNLQEFSAMVEKFMNEGSSLPGVVRGRTDTWNLDTSHVANTYLHSQWVYSASIYKDDSGRYAWGPCREYLFA